MTNKDADLAKEFGPRALQAALSMVAIQLALGRLEDAASSLDSLAADPGVQKALADDRLRPEFQRLRYHKLMMEGNFAEAGELLEAMAGEIVRQDRDAERRRNFRPTPFAQGRQMQVLWEMYSPLSNLLSPSPLESAARTFGRHGVFSEFAAFQNNLAARRSAESQFYMRRGLLSLYEGDIPAARARFLQMRASPERKAEDAKWGVGEDPRVADAELYLRLIDDAARRAAPK
jgi:hypothetical protein